MMEFVIDTVFMFVLFLVFAPYILIHAQTKT